MFIVCHYGEIALKGNNRKYFEEILVKNIKSALKSDNAIKRISGRIIVDLKENFDKEKISAMLKKTFGIAHFCFAEESGQNIKEIREKSLEILEKKNFSTFKINAKRSEKNFLLTSQQINEQVGEYILNKLKIEVDLENPDITVFIEVVEKYCFIYTEKILGPGGLPVGSSGKAVVLLSGGIDSPVSAYLSQKRGIETILVHLKTSETSKEKAKKLAETLLLSQPSGIKVYIVPFAEIQKEIAQKAKEKLRCVFCKKTMLKIAKEIAKNEGVKVIVTGENVGQVASQTLENLSAIEKNYDLLILRPLSSFDKNETIKIAKEIGTFGISILKEKPCAIVPRFPETKAKLEEVEKEEKILKIDSLIKKSLASAEIYQF